MTSRTKIAVIELDYVGLPLANAVDEFFFEVHENPEVALSDGPNMIYLKDLHEILKCL